MNSINFANQIRIESLKMVAQAKASHIGGALSAADILAVLYNGVLNVDPTNIRWSLRDRFIMSKGHCCSALYAALALRQFFPLRELSNYGQDGSRLMAHASCSVPGVEFSTGSLGHGLPFACGKALAAKRRSDAWRTFVLMSDGELNEGSNWEAFLFAPQVKLDNLVCIVDYNKIQSLGRVQDVLELEPLADKIKAFRWSVREVDGHDHDQLRQALQAAPHERFKPTCIIAHTVKGKGVSFMENKLQWHYSSPTQDQLAQAVAELTTVDPNK